MEKILIADLSISYQDVLDAMIETKKSIDVTRESTAELMKANKALEEDGKKGSDQWQKNARAIETNNVSLKGLTSEYSANQKVLTTNLHTKNAELGTIEKLDARNKELRLGLRGLNLETENGRKKQKEYITEIDRNTKFIKENSDAQVKQYMNVGNYKSALEGIGPSMINFGKQLLSGVGIAALAMAAINKLKEAIMSTSTAMDRMNVYTQISKQLFYDLATSGNVSAESLKKVALAAEKLNEIRKGDRKDKVEFAKLERDIAMAEFEAADRTKSHAEQAQALGEAIRLQNELANVKVADLKEELLVTRELMELRPKDEALKEKQADLIEQIIKADTERFTQAKRNETRLTAFQKEETDRLKQQHDALMQAADEEIAILDEKDNLIREKRKNHLEKLAVDTVVSFEKEIEAFKASANILQESRINGELETQQLIYDSRVANNDQVYEAEKQLLEAEMKAELANASKTGAERYLIEKKYSGYMTALARQEQEAKLAITSDFAGSLATLFGENTAVGRIAAVAQATINTYLGATSAFAQTPGGIVIKSLAAGAAIASGLASVKKILSTKSGLPGDSGGGSANISASVPGAGATSANFESDPTTGFTDQFSAIKNALAAQPPAVLVIEDFQNVAGRAIAVTETGKL